MAEPDALDPHLEQTFVVARPPDEAIDAAQRYLAGAGTITPALQGRMERFGDRLAVHHGRVRTTVTATEGEAGTRIDIRRTGQVPLEETRRWLYAIGLGGFLVALALTLYNDRAAKGLPPLLTLTMFFVAVVLVLAVLFVADRSLERRSESLVLSLEDAIRGEPLDVLAREVGALERSSALANGLIFYGAALLLEFLVFVIVLSDGVRQGIDEAAALASMRFGLLIPILPALLFAGIQFLWANRVHRERFETVRRRG